MRRFVVRLAVAVVAAAVPACSSDSDSGGLVGGAITTSSTTSGEAEESTTVPDDDPVTEDVFSLAVGDCFSNPLEGEEVQEVETVDCGVEHDGEVFAEFDVTADSDTFPGNDEVVAQSEQGCADRFEGFVGVATTDSTLDVLYLYPTEQSWDRLDDRQVLCIVGDSAGAITGTLEGAAR